METAEGDFGDAPDGTDAGYPGVAVAAQFPTLLASDGARILNPGQDTLGAGVSGERDANDPADPDGAPNLVNDDAFDDGLVELQVVLAGPRPAVNLAFNAKVTTEAPTGPRFLNVLIDRNLDGRWGGVGPDEPREWVVENWSEPISSGGSVRIAPPPIEISAGGRLPDGAWMRVLLTREMLNVEDWDGSGTFDFGEVEDYQIFLPSLAVDGTDQIQKAPALTATCPQVVDFGGIPLVEIACTVANFGAAGAGGFSVSAENGARILPASVWFEEVAAGTVENVSFLAFANGEESLFRLIPDAEPIPFKDRGDGTIEFEIVPAQAGGRIQNTAARCADCMIDDPVGDNTFLESPKSQALPLPWADIVGATAWTVYGSYFGTWFNGVDPLACGTVGFAGPNSWVLCDVGAPIMLDGPVLIATLELDEPLPTGPDSTFTVEYALAVDEKGAPEHNWRAPKGFEYDLYQGTDHWFKLIFTPPDRFDFVAQRVHGGDTVFETATRSRVLLFDRYVVFIVPLNEFGLEQRPFSGVRLSAASWDAEKGRGVANAGSADTAGWVGPEFVHGPLFMPPDGPKLITASAPRSGEDAAGVAAVRAEPLLLERLTIAVEHVPQASYPIAGDWDADGVDDLGFYYVFDGEWIIFYSRTGFEEPDLTFYFGSRDEMPVVGDWNGDGRDDVGLFDPTQGDWRLSYSAFPPEKPDLTFTFGMRSFPLAGDWDGDGRDDVGTYTRTKELFVLAEGLPPSGDAPVHELRLTVELGLPLAGDFDGDGVMDVGVYDPATGDWAIDLGRQFDPARVYRFQFFPQGAWPVVGDFNGDGRDDIGSFYFDYEIDAWIGAFATLEFESGDAAL